MKSFQVSENELFLLNDRLYCLHEGELSEYRKKDHLNVRRVKRPVEAQEGPSLLSLVSKALPEALAPHDPRPDDLSAMTVEIRGIPFDCVSVNSPHVYLYRTEKVQQWLTELAINGSPIKLEHVCLIPERISIVSELELGALYTPVSIMPFRIMASGLDVSPEGQFQTGGNPSVSPHPNDLFKIII